MKLFKRISTAALALAIAATGGVASFAATESDGSQLDSTKAEYAVNAHFKIGQGERREMTEEQKAETLAKAKEMLGSRLADGKITQEQYDQAFNNLDNGKMVGLVGRAWEGENLEITEEQKAEMLAKAKELLDSRLADGKITQEQYDQAISDIDNGEIPTFRTRIGGGAAKREMEAKDKEL